MEGRSAEKPLILVGFSDAVAAIESIWSLEGAGFQVVCLHRARTKTALASTGNITSTCSKPASRVARREAHALAWRALCSHAPLSSSPTHGAERNRILEASWPACLQR